MRNGQDKVKRQYLYDTIESMFDLINVKIKPNNNIGWKNIRLKKIEEFFVI